MSPGGIIGWSLIIGLASYRVWRLVALDTITERLRLFLPSWLSDWIQCPWCLTVWITAGLTALSDPTVSVGNVFIWVVSATIAAWLGVADKRMNG